jgi:hypothetical protein
VVVSWDTLSDRSMSRVEGARATGDRKPNGWLQAVVAFANQKYTSCGDLTFLQRSVVKGC